MTKAKKYFFLVGFFLLTGLKTFAADTFFSQNSKALMKKAGCTYDLEKTYVSAFEKPGYCSGITLKVCHAVLKCPNLYNSEGMAFECVAPQGKCPKDPMECRFGENAITKRSFGLDIIESDNDQPKSISPQKSLSTDPYRGGGSSAN